MDTYTRSLHAGAVLGQDVWVLGGSAPSQPLNAN